MVSLGVDNEGEGNWLQRAAKKLAEIGGGRGEQSSEPGSIASQVIKSNAGPIANASRSGSIINSPFTKASSFGAGSSGRFGSSATPKPQTKSAPSSMMKATSQPNDLELLIQELLGQTKEGHTWESRAQDQDMIEQIFGAELAKIGNARNTTNERFNTSKAETQSLYDGHEHDIRNADKASYQGIATDQANATNQIYDSGVQQMQAGQNANRDASIEMMNRLGLQASAPVAQETANESQKAIDSLVTAKTQQQTQNQGYASADMRRNDERAGSIADEGVAQQADLTRQLQDILGELGNKEADINSQKAEAMMGAFQRSEDNWRGDREYATSALAALMESQAEAASKSQEIQQSNAPQMQNIMNGLGITDPALQTQYSSAYTDAMLNANYVPGGAKDEKTAYLKYLIGNDEYDSLDPNLLRQLISSDLNYGSYKVGAPTS